MVNMKKASAATDAKKIVQDQYTTFFHNMWSAVYEPGFKNVVKMARKKIELYADDEKERAYYKGFAAGISLVLESLSWTDEESEEPYDTL